MNFTHSLLGVSLTDHYSQAFGSVPNLVLFTSIGSAILFLGNPLLLLMIDSLYEDTLILFTERLFCLLAKVQIVTNVVIHTVNALRYGLGPLPRVVCYGFVVFSNITAMIKLLSICIMMALKILFVGVLRNYRSFDEDFFYFFSKWFMAFVIVLFVGVDFVSSSLGRYSSFCLCTGKEYEMEQVAMGTKIQGGVILMTICLITLAATLVMREHECMRQLQTRSSVSVITPDPVASSLFFPRIYLGRHGFRRCLLRIHK